MKRLLLLAMLVLGATFAPRVHAQGDADRDAQAREYFGLGRYREALDIYGKLFAETLHPTYLRNIARCYQNMGEPEKALATFREYLRKAKDLKPGERAEVEGYMREMDQEIKRRQQGAPLLSPSGAAAEPQARLVADASPAERDEAPPMYKRAWFWVAVGVVAAAAAGTAIVLSSRSSAPPAADLGYMTANPK